MAASKPQSWSGDPVQPPPPPGGPKLGLESSEENQWTVSPRPPRHSVDSKTFPHLPRIEMEDSEAAGVSDIVSNLIGVFPRSALTALPGDLFASFIAGLTLLTCSFGRSAALEEAVSNDARGFFLKYVGVCCWRPSAGFPSPPQLHKDDVVYTKAYDQLLEAWLTLVQDEEHFPRGCFVQPAVQVFNSYIQCHLAAPDGTRAQVRGLFSTISTACSSLGPGMFEKTWCLVCFWSVASTLCPYDLLVANEFNRVLTVMENLEKSWNF